MVPEYFVVSVREEEITGYNQKTGKDIVKKYKYEYLVKAADPKTAAGLVEKDMESCTNDWKIVSVKESKITNII
jgi:hypothetical protein